MPRRYAMETRNAETVLRRQRMVDAAIEVLGEVGAHGFTMELAADRADMATRTLYNHFPTREDLIGEALGALLDVFRRDLNVEVLEDGSPRERLHRFVQVLFEIYGRQGAALTTLLDHRDMEQVAAQTHGMRAWRRERLETILRSARAELRMPLGQAAALALVLTNHASWRTLTEECGLAPSKALAATTAALDGLFSERA